MTENSSNTEVLSVSVSKDFIKYVHKYKLSPTEVFRKGMAVCLFEAGEDRYQSETNKKRTECVNAFLEKYNTDKVLKELFDRIVSLHLLITENSSTLNKKEDDELQRT